MSGNSALPVLSTPDGEVRAIGPSIKLDSWAGVEPSWEILARVSGTTLDPGSKLRIEVYLSGYGRVDSAKLVVAFPAGLLQNFLVPGGSDSHPRDAKVTTRSHSVAFNDAAQSGSGPGPPVEFPSAETQTFYSNEGGGGLAMDLGFSLELFNLGAKFPSPLVAQERSVRLVQTAGEVRLNSSGPVNFDATMSANAHPGDHFIPFVLTYMVDKKVRTSTFTLQLHIRPFWERAWFQYLAAGALVLASAASVAAIGLAIAGK